MYGQPPFPVRPGPPEPRGNRLGRRGRLRHSPRVLRRLLLVSLLPLTGLAAGTPAYAQDTTVPIFFAGYGTPHVDVLAGDSVNWHNDSVRTHTVNSADGTWASP